MSQFTRANVEQPKQCVVERCDRCGGSGIFHIFGTCFRCGGNGKDPTHRGWGFPKAWTDEQCQQWLDARQQRLDKARATREAKKTAKQLAVYRANAEVYPVLGQFHDTSGSGGWPIVRESLSERLSPVVRDILGKSIRYPLSVNQAAVLEKALADIADRDARKAAERAEAKTPEAGRHVVEGTVLSLKESHLDIGYRRTVTQIKALVKCDGYKLFGTVPAAIVGDCKVGDTVRFTATVEPKEPGFGFFSRPTGAEILALT